MADEKNELPEGQKTAQPDAASKPDAKGKGRKRETACAQCDDLQAQVELLQSALGDGTTTTGVRLREKYVAHGYFGTISFKAHEIVTDPATIQLLRELKAPIGPP